MLGWFKRLLIVSLTALGSFTLICAQPPSPKPPASDVTTLYTGTQLVILNVVVTDSHENPVRNLNASDFVVLEKGVPQQIKTFEEHTASASVAAAKPEPAALPGIFSNYAPIPHDGPLNILLFDALNTPITDQAFLRDQLKQYVNTVPPGANIAIFGLNSRLVLLQGFTSNSEVLKAAINGTTNKTSRLLEDAVGGVSPPMTASQALTQNSIDPAVLKILPALKTFETEQQSSQDNNRALITLDAFNQLARYLSNIPGRKNLIWFSGSFPISILPGTGDGNNFSAVVSAEEEFRQTVHLLTLSQVSVYPIDTRGVLTSPVLDPANRLVLYAIDPGKYAQDEDDFAQKSTNDRNTMLQIARDTGGRAYMNTNNLSQSVRRAIAAGSNYYTLIYSPTNLKWNGEFRTIEVKFQQKGLNLNLSYRRGYYADNPNAPQNRDTAIASHSPTKRDTMHAAMMPGAPEPTQIVFKVRVVPASPVVEDHLAPNNVNNPSAKTKGPYRRYAIDYAADPRAIFFKLSPEGNHLAAIRFVTYVYNRDGMLLTVVDNKTTADLTPSNYLETLKSGIPWHQEVSVPVKGDFLFRIGVHDLSRDRIGAVEIPVAMVENLRPASPLQ